MRRIAITAVGFLALAGVVGFLATRPFGGAGLAPAEAPSVAGAAREVVAADEAVAGVPAPAAGGVAEGGAVAGGGGLGSIGEVPMVGPRIVKTADLHLLVGKGGFQDAFEEAQLVAGKYGGFVVSSSSHGTRVRSGSLLLRVPNASFERALADLRDLGRVEGESISGEDVSAQFVDLEARLRAWEAQESVLLRLMERATSVEDTLRIQRELQDVQLRIEEIRGQLRVLRDRTELATITVRIREPGAAIREEIAARERRPDLGEAWARAVDAFLGVAYVVVVGLGYLVPIAGLAAVVLSGARRWRARAGRAVPAP
ncbi:MAG TPA: DUF4349 domain-containing protein [Actinomycetota bacterium]|nr:DUF4349 domain-containing protein [Actinomycetota bacterium]